MSISILNHSKFYLELEVKDVIIDITYICNSYHFRGKVKLYEVQNSKSNRGLFITAYILINF